ncbi:hypothetical protein P4S72_26535 [Vibrio sp. PP-XX7]
MDYAPYPGTLGLPTGFISAPVYDKQKQIGVVVFALSSSKLTELMTYGYNWQASGLGQTGETYLVSTDHMPKTASRFLLENPEKFTAQVNQLGYGLKMSCGYSPQKPMSDFIRLNQQRSSGR